MKKKNNKYLILVVIILLVFYFFKNNNNKLISVEISENHSLEYSEKMLNIINDGKENILYSDLTLNPTLALFYSQGSDKAKNELSSYFISSEDTILDNYDKIYKRYKFASKNINYSNSMWINSNNAGISKDAKKISKDKLHFDINNRKFSNANTIKEINNWVNKKSHNKIKSELKESDISDAHSVLIGTLYFNEKWLNKYEEKDIHNGQFKGSEKQSTVTYLTSDENYYLETNTAEGFMKPYEDKGLYFIGIIPKKGYQLVNANIKELLNSKKDTEVEVKIPEFTYECNIDLKNSLMQSGINSIFTSGNLDEIAPTLYVAKIFQKNYIKVDRTGTEAFSVNYTINETWGDIGGKRFVYLDQPFIYLIYDETINQALFIGQVNNL